MIVKLTASMTDDHSPQGVFVRELVVSDVLQNDQLLSGYASNQNRSGLWEFRLVATYQPLGCDRDMKCSSTLGCEG